MKDLSLTLTRRRLITGTASLVGASILSGCGTKGGSSTTTPVTPALTNPQPVPGGPLVQGALQISTTSGGLIPAGFMGLSYEKFTLADPYFNASNADLIALFQRLGTGAAGVSGPVLRLGGGTVDQCLWTPDGNGTTYLQITPSNVTDLAAFLKLTGWQCLYGVNLATSTPALAAAEVANVVTTLGSSLLGIEIGNATDQYGATGSYFPGNWTFQDFLTRWQSFQSAILAETPHALLTGPSCSATSVSNWTLPFGQAIPSGQVSLLTEQYFRANGLDAVATAEYLVSPDTVLNSYLATMNTGAQTLGIPYRIAGCNSFYSGGAPGISNSYASSLWVLDFLFSAAQGGATGVNMHGGGKIYYTPIADSGGVVSAASPEYYGLLLFSMAGAGTLMQTQFSAGSLNATAYAIKSASGGMSLILVNKDSTQNLSIAVTTSQSVQSATLLAMTAPSLAATSGVTIQGATVNPDGTFAPSSAYTLAYSGTQTSCYVPALSAVLIQLT